MKKIKGLYLLSLSPHDIFPVNAVDSAFILSSFLSTTTKTSCSE